MFSYIGPGRRVWLGGALALVVAVVCGLLLTQLLLSPPRSDLRTLAIYLSLSGGATIAGGALAIGAIDRRGIVPGIQSKSLLAALTGTAVALLNILIIAQLMFVSTSHDLRLLVALIGFSAVVTVFFAMWVASVMVARLDTIASAVRVLASGRLSERAPVSGHDQVAALAADVNVLADRMESAEAERSALDRERRELTASISHDLRTPLASLRAMVEALDDEVISDRSEIRRYYVTIRREIGRLSRMIDDLFELAQIDAGALRLDKQRVALDEVAAGVVDAMKVQAERAGIALGISAEPHLPSLTLDGLQLERAIANLVRNGLEHTPPGGEVTVSVVGDQEELVLQIRDTGEGISPADLPFIWTRFYRADKSRAYRTNGDDGAGLGLAITRGIIESHGGTIYAASELGCGTTVTIRLPLVPQCSDGAPDLLPA